jgi:myo-inositol-1(or 4)-monophosphatase
MPNSNDCPIKLGDMIDIAYVAGGIMKTYFTHYGMERAVKTDTTPLTKADIEINRLVVEKIRTISSSVDIKGEEESDRRENPWQIVCDPVDGTFPYTWGVPVSTFMLGLLYEGKAVKGVIYDPFMDRMYSAEKGSGAFLNGSISLKVSAAKEWVDRPVVGYVSWPVKPPVPNPNFNMLSICHYLEQRGVTMINLCSAGYVEALVANGEFAASIFPGPETHDTAPGDIIIREAGGMTTDIMGEPLNYAAGRIQGHIFSNGVIHDLVLEAVRVCNPPILK